MRLVSELRPLKITGRRCSSNYNHSSVNGEIDDQHVFLALEKLRHTQTKTRTSAAKSIFPTPAGAGADILLGTIYSSESPTGMSLADSSLSSASDAESEKRKSRSSSVPNVADDHNKSTADADTNTNTNSLRIPRIPESFRNMAKNLPCHWERIRSLVTHLSSEMNCLGEENVNVTLEETVNFLYLDRDEEGGTTTFEDTFEGNTTFDEVTTLTFDDDTLFSNFIDDRINTSIEHVPRKNNNNKYRNKGYTGTAFMFDVDDQEDDDDHPYIHSIFDGSSTVDDTTHLSSLWKASAIAYEAASDDLENDNDNNNHVDVDSHHHEHPNDTDWGNNEEENNILSTRNRNDHNTRLPSSPLTKPVSLELELGLNRDDGTTDDTGILRSFIVIPTTITSAKQNNCSVEEVDDDGTPRDFPFDNDDTVSLLTTDIALMTTVSSPSLSPSKKTLLRSSSPSSKLLARLPSFFFNNNNNNHKMRSRSTAAIPSSSHSLSRSRSKAAAVSSASSAATVTSRSSSTKMNKFWKRFIM